MRFVNIETPTFAGSAGSSQAPGVAEALQLVDRDGNVLVTFTKGVAGTFSHDLPVSADVTDSIQDAVDALVASAPGALDTLDELAAALGDDASFAATLTTSLAAKAPLASPTFTGAVAGITKTMVGLGNADNTSDASKPVSTATQTALDLKLTTGADLIGTTTNDNAAAGEVGELLTASLASGTPTSLVTSTAKTIISLSLTAGDWDVWGVADYIPDGTTTTAVVQQGISQTDNTLGGQDTFTSSSGGNLSGTVLGSLITENAPHQRISLAETTTVYLIGRASFAISTMTAYGSIFARRRR